MRTTLYIRIPKGYEAWLSRAPKGKSFAGKRRTEAKSAPVSMRLVVDERTDVRLVLLSSPDFPSRAEKASIMIEWHVRDGVSRTRSSTIPLLDGVGTIEFSLDRAGRFVSKRQAKSAVRPYPRTQKARRPKAAFRGTAVVGRGAGERAIRYPVWFGTNRQAINPSDASCTDFGDNDAGALFLGKAMVRVPQSHKIGSLGSHLVWRIAQAVDDRVAVLGRTRFKDEHTFGKSIQDALPPANSGRERGVLVFVHGFRVSFDGALRRAAQIGADLGFSGVMLVFSWPSGGRLARYFSDEAAVEASEEHFDTFLSLVRQAVPASVPMYLLAHSMGSRILMRQLERASLVSPSGESPRYKRCAIAAADIHTLTLESKAARICRATNRLASYFSDRDRALLISSLIHRGDRAGYSPPVLKSQQIEAVKAGGLDDTLLGHSYFAEQEALIRDLYRYLFQGASPEQRSLMRREGYWEVKKSLG